MSKSLPPGFLMPDKLADDFAFLPPPRKHCKVEPLIDACKTFRAIEEAILAAKKSIRIATWDLQTDFNTTSRKASEAQLTKWTQLLTDAVERGIDVRIILNDFDPLLPGLLEWHLDAWKSYRHLMNAAKFTHNRSMLFDPSRFQVICSIHNARLDVNALGLPSGWIATFRLKEITDSLNSKKQESGGVPGALIVFDSLPRLWDKITFDKTSYVFKTLPTQSHSYHIASHHQKLCIIDDQSAFLGGIDIKGQVLDHQNHKANPFRHDIHCKVEGSVVSDLNRVFIGRWNQEYLRAQNSVKFFNTIASSKLLPISKLNSIKWESRIKTKKYPGISLVQVIRTATGEIPPAPSKKTPTLSSQVPHVIRADIEVSYREAIRSAKQFIYIENQYIRWPLLVDWILEALRKNRLLQVIIVVPFMPEEADKNVTDFITLHGMHLSYKILSKIEKFFNAGIFTLVSHVDEKDPASRISRCLTTTKKDSEHETPLLGFGNKKSPAIYVHSKVMIIDDRFATIGSANLDGRSFRIDNEVNIAWQDPKAIRRFRLELWRELLGPGLQLASTPVSQFIGLWKSRALLNRIPTLRKGFIVPYSTFFAPAPKGKEIAIDGLDVYARNSGDQTAGQLSQTKIHSLRSSQRIT